MVCNERVIVLVGGENEREILVIDSMMIEGWASLHYACRMADLFWGTLTVVSADH